MKKLKATLTLSVAGVLFLSNNCLAATTNAVSSTATSSTTKYIAIGVAAVIIALLLFLGYKMDSKENGDFITSKKSKSNKKEKNTKNEDIKYEADNVSYKADEVSGNDLSETMEYEEDNNNEEDEGSLFSAMSDDYELGSSTDIAEDNKELEEYGEDFDTSIIDNIDDEEESVESPKINMEETMVFDNPPTLNSEDAEELEDTAEKLEEVDPIMEELSHIDTTESDFEGFSTKTDKKEEKKPRKKYTKVKKDSISTDDFLAQMEENLKKDKKERDAKKGK